MRHFADLTLIILAELKSSKLPSALGRVLSKSSVMKNSPGEYRLRRSEVGKRIVTINDILAQEANSELLIIKIDIEGFESDLFSSGTEWVDKACLIIVEPHDWMLPNQGSSRRLQEVMSATKRELLILGENLAWVKRPTALDISLNNGQH